MNLDFDSPRMILDIQFLVIHAIGDLDFQIDDEDEIVIALATLRSCALTCRAWLDTARNLLYRFVIMFGRKHCQLFSRTLLHSALLALKVQDLCCNLADWDYVGIERSRKIEMPLSPLVVSRLANLKTALFVGKKAERPVAMPTPFVYFVRSFAGCEHLHTLNLLNIHLHNFEHLSGTVWSFVNMKTLNLIDCSWGPLREPAASYPAYDDSDHPERQRQRLTDLQICRRSTFHDMDAVLHLVNPTKIKCLELISDMDGQEQFAAIPRFISLEDLAITVNSNGFPWIMKILSNVRSTKIEQIYIGYLAKDASLEDAAASAILADSHLDDALCSDKFANLHCIFFRLKSTRALGRAEKDVWAKRIEACLPRCSERKILTVIISPDYVLVE